MIKKGNVWVKCLRTCIQVSSCTHGQKVDSCLDEAYRYKYVFADHVPALSRDRTEVNIMFWTVEVDFRILFKYKSPPFLNLSPQTQKRLGAKPRWKRLSPGYLSSLQVGLVHSPRVSYFSLLRIRSRSLGKCQFRLITPKASCRVLPWTTFWVCEFLCCFPLRFWPVGEL